MVNEREAWLNLTVEEAIEPDLPICDPHHHLWERPDNRYLLDELLRDLGGGHSIVQTVFVECRSMYRNSGPEEMRPVGETEFVQGIAAQSASGQYGTTVVAAGIVGHANLSLGNAVAPVLEAQVVASKNRFRGIRHISAWDESPGRDAQQESARWAADGSKVQEGFGCLQRYGLSFDAWLYHTQLVELVDLARTFPEVPIIADHIAGPLGIGPYAGRREEVFQEWKQGIAELAACPNVVVKVGGLGMAIGGFGWHQRSTPARLRRVSRSHGALLSLVYRAVRADRCMFESNSQWTRQRIRIPSCGTPSNASPKISQTGIVLPCFTTPP